MEKSCFLEPEVLRRSSLLYNDAECSSPTSWEFHGLVTSPSSSSFHHHPPPHAPSSVPIQGSPSCSSPFKSVVETSKSRTENRRNSSGSRGGSHPSHDSGFSYDGVPVIESRQNVVTDNVVNQGCQYPGRILEESEYSYSLACDNSVNVDIDTVRSGNLACDKCVNVNIDMVRSANSSYYEVIVAPEGSPYPDNMSVLGAPACCSTPKEQKTELKKRSRLNIMQKIDNFESLNKNILLDSNNNSFEDKKGKSTSAAIVSALKRSTNSKTSLSSNGSKSSLHANVNEARVRIADVNGNGQNDRSGGTNSNGRVQRHEEIYYNGCNDGSGGINCNGHVQRQEGPGRSSNNYERNRGSGGTSCYYNIDRTGGSNNNCNRNTERTGESNYSHRNFERSEISDNCPGQIQKTGGSKSSLVRDRHLERSQDSKSSLSSTGSKDLTLQTLKLNNNNNNISTQTKNNLNFQLESTISYSDTQEPSYLPSPLHPSLRSKFLNSAVVTTETSSGVLVVRSQADNEAPLRLWLHELRSSAEPECLNTLQMKDILPSHHSKTEIVSSRNGKTQRKPEHCGSPPPPNQVNMTAIHSVSAALQSVRNVERMASIISGEFSKICKHLEFGLFAPVPSLVSGLSDNLDEFLSQLNKNNGTRKLENRLASLCVDLRKCGGALGVYMSRLELSESGTIRGSLGKSDEDEREFHSIVGELVEGIVTLGNLFGQVVDGRLKEDLSTILEVIEGGELLTGVGLKSFVQLLNDSSGSKHICRLAASIRTVPVLLRALINVGNDQDKVLALRCLATILCAAAAVADFDQAGGFQIVTDILCDSRCPLVIKFEAVAVLAQATDPWIDCEASLANLSAELEKIIVCLTYMIPQCQYYEDSFLLIVATFSNLTFLEPFTTELLRRHRALAKIISAVKSKPDFSIFVLDHVSTILANAAGSERCRKEIVRCGGVITLLCFLQQRPCPFESAAEVAACERLQQRSTVAISRLCVEDCVPSLILDMGGMQRMIQLCRQERERNYSDGVLIACLATIRKLAPFCSDVFLKEINAEELIRPKLLDAFLMFSSRQESYV